MVTFVEHFRHYLHGRHFVVRTDHASLKWLKNFKDVDGMLSRWLTKLDVYDYELVHRRGALHGNADGLSRKPTHKCPRDDCPQCTSHQIDAIIVEPDGHEQEKWLTGWTMGELKTWQRNDPDLGRVIEWLEQSPNKPKSHVIRQYGPGVRNLMSQWGVLFLEDGVLKRKWYPSGHLQTRPVFQIVAPDPIKKIVLTSLHNSPTGGHLGDFKTLGKVRQRFYWVGYKRDVLRWCQQCDVCAQSKPGPHRKRAKLGHVPVRAPLERIAVDIMGPLPKTVNDNEYIMVVGDYFTKWTEAYALKDHTAQTVAEVLIEHFICRFGVPMQIHSDQGREFESNLISELCKLLRVDKSRTTPYNPKSDGLVERFNRTVQQMLTVLINEAQDDWDDHLPYVMMAYRASPHESTRCSPNLMMLNREVTLPIDLITGNPNSDFGPSCPIEYVEWVRYAKEHAFQLVQEHLRVSAERQKQLYDRNSGTPELKNGDSVWRYYPPQARRKFGKGWKGPYLVTRRLSSHVYEIQLTPRSSPLVVHVDHLKKYEGPLPVKNWLINHDDGPQPPHIPVGPGPEFVSEEARPGDEISEEEAEVVLDLDDPPQSPEAPEVSPDVSTEGPEDAPNQSLPLELSSSQDNHSNNPTNSNLAGYQGTQQPINPNLRNDLSVRRSSRPLKPKVIWDPSDL